MVSYNETMLKEITKFLNNIYYAKGRKLDTVYLPMWTREIIATGATAPDLHKAEAEIIRTDTPLVINEVCDIIREQVYSNKIKLIYKNDKCPYCEGRGWVEGLKFEKNGKYTGYTFALNCCCGSNQQPNMLIMKEDLSNNHKTECKDWYYLIFTNVCDKFSYLDKVYANDNFDIRRG